MQVDCKVWSLTENLVDKSSKNKRSRLPPVILVVAEDTLTLGIISFEPLNLRTLAMSDLCCSKKQNRGIDIVLTVRVKSCNRSTSISESFSTTLSRLLCSPSETADAMEAMSDALD